MNRLGRWAVTVVTMVSVATVVLLVTGWGSALAANVSSVLVANGPSNPVPVQQQGTADVNITNTTPMSVKSGDVASVLGQGETSLSALDNDSRSIPTPRMSVPTAR